MDKPKKAAARIVRPRLGATVIVRAPFFPKPTTALVIGLYDEDTEDIAVQVFPVGRDPLQIPAIPFFVKEPGADVRSAAWPA